MLYVTYRHRQQTGRELVLRDGARFPEYLTLREWYLHATHTSVSGRTEADIATLGYCDRTGGAISDENWCPYWGHSDTRKP